MTIATYVLALVGLGRVLVLAYDALAFGNKLGRVHAPELEPPPVKKPRSRRARGESEIYREGPVTGSPGTRAGSRTTASALT